MESAPGLKTGVENNSFWSEIGSGFGEPSGTLPPSPGARYADYITVKTPSGGILHSYR